jgi:N-acyl amino acid synthase of PEP-CTERM/exosortase system
MPMYSITETNISDATTAPPFQGVSRGLPLFEEYRRVFEGVPANTPTLRRAAHQLRYQVYCVENKYEDPADNPGGLEYDEYDSHALHAVLLHRRTRTFVGTVRVVLHKPGARRGSLPFHHVCEHSCLRDPHFLPLEATAEIGRFAISKAFCRQLRHGTDYRFGGLGNVSRELRRLFPHVSLGLIKVALELSIPFRIRYVCAVMEPTLLRLLTKFGILFQSLGDTVDYHGKRQPCYANIAELLARVKVERPEVWEVITDRGRLCPPPQALNRASAVLA